jgi:hypothetical protein
MSSRYWRNGLMRSKPTKEASQARKVMMISMRGMIIHKMKLKTKKTVGVLSLKIALMHSCR